MTYGLGTGAFIEDGPTNLAVEASARRSTARAWRVLDEAHRIAAIERALRPANDRFDGYPLAL